MFGLYKLIVGAFFMFRNLLNVDKNALQNVPTPTKYLAMIFLSLFWCLAFGIYFGELLFIGYNMAGHVALITMVFATWAVFKHFEKTYTPKPGINYLRMPDRSSRCDEYTDEQRLALVAKTAASTPVASALS